MARKKPAEPNREKLFTVVIILVVIITVLVATMTLGADENSPPIETSESEQSKQPSSVAAQGEAVSGLAEEAVLDVTEADFFVGVVSGHKGYDPGAVCDDGLTEADVNYVVAQEVVALLQRRGIRAEVLDEY
ncbi:MAG: N-acetylmuramoyl-L-alanine amidase, partial [Anaerolineae bacterium]|nr:N-acetylmuramoyl-L-alanine amidase [Anaerolineae bacterium]